MERYHDSVNAVFQRGRWYMLLSDGKDRFNPERENIKPPKMTKTTAAVILISIEIMIICLMLVSCTVTHRPVETYTVKEVHKVSNGHSTVKLEELGGWVELPSDTLKRGDKITVTYLRPVNNFKRK